jgi:hypothetical protein
MKKSDSHSSADAALRTVAAARTLQARRVLHAAKESLDNVAKANNVQLISSSRTTPAAEEDS